MTSENGKILLGGLLAFCVLSSKHIVLYNEEILVACSFLAFLVFCFHTLSDTVAESFQARSDAIQTELQNYLTLKEDYVQDLLSQHKEQLDLHTALTLLKEFSVTDMHAIGSSRERTLQSLFAHQVQHKLKSLVYANQSFNAKLQSLVALGFRDAVIEEYQKSKKELQPQLIQQALTSLRTM
jgi:F0F1-type ATP synthase membrane subunit b/b'